MSKKLKQTLVTVALLSVGAAAHANTVDSASSKTWDYLLNATNNFGTMAAPIPGSTSNVMGSAPAPYSEAKSVDNYALQLGGSTQKAVFQAASMSSSASSNVDGVAGSKTTVASTLLTGFDYYSYFSGGYKVELTMDSIGSTSTVTGMPGSFAATGVMTLSNLLLKIDDLPVLTLSGPVAANTTYGPNDLKVGSGITLVLNKQTGNCGAENCGISTDAFHMTFDNSPVFGPQFGMTNGYIILGHSEAHMAGVVPEPETWAMMLAGLGLVSLALRRRRN